jgi:ABC-type transport system substrate-binding protein
MSGKPTGRRNVNIRRRKLFAGSAGIAAASYLPITSELAQAQATRTLVIAGPGTPEGFDGDVLKPLTQDCVVQCYEGLVRYARIERDGRSFLDPTRLEPHLAESWKAAPDGKSYVFKLRESVRSARGNELTAADVDWSWNKSLQQKRTGAFIATVSNVTAVKAISRYEVEFTLSAPSAIFLNALTLYVPPIFDSTELKKHATTDDPWALKWMDGNTAGFGAYHLSELRAGEQAIFVANPHYFRGKPYFERIVYRAVPSAGSRVTLLKSRQVQWIDRPTVQQAKDLEADRNVKVQSSPGRAMASVRMNAGLKPFDDRRVRQAFNYAVNKELIRKAVFLDTGDLAKSIVPPVVGGYDTSFFVYDPDPAKARALLAEAGYASGLEVELLYGGERWWEEPIAIQVADQLRAVGVTAKPVKITVSDQRARAAPARQDLPFFTFEDGPIVLDPVYAMYLMVHSKGVSNRARYANPRVDALIDEGRETLDRDKRYALMREVQKLWMEDAPWLCTIYPTIHEAMAPNIVGWTPHPDDHERWSDLKIA